jgi:hypothetical protein
MTKKRIKRPNAPWARDMQRCALCGWGAHRAIHLPVLDGPRKGSPWGHAYKEAVQKGGAA